MLPEAGLSVLSSMITPVVLISACGTLILSTSNRLGRASDRVRRFFERARALDGMTGDAATHEERALIEALLPKLIRRVRLIHLSLTAFYLSVGLSVLSSLAIAMLDLLGWSVGILPAWLVVAAALALAAGAALLTIEAQLSLASNLAEMKFIGRQVNRQRRTASAPSDQP